MIGTNKRAIGSCIVAGSAALLMASVPAHAQSALDEPAPQLQKLQECRAIADPESRLACFDRETDALIAATDSGEVKIVSREQAREARKSLFGFRLPSLGIFKSSGDESDAEEEVSSISSTIKRVSAYGRGTYLITIEQDDAVWQTTEASPFFREPDVGEPVEIKRAALGSYFLSVDGRKRVRAKRVD